MSKVQINYLILFILSVSIIYSATNSELRKQIKIERKILKVLQEQIDELKDVANRKVEIKNFSKEGKKDLVQTEFLKDITAVLTLLKKNKTDEAVKEFKYLQIIYRNRLEVEDLLLYYKGYFYAIDGNDEKSVANYETLISKYPNSKFYTNAREYLSSNYLKNDLNEKVVELLEGKSLSKKEAFNLLNSKINLSQFDNLSELFTDLQNSEFQFEVDYIKGIYLYATESIDSAISHYKNISQNYNPKKQENYNLIYLNLGRLFAENEEFSNANEYYNLYIESLGKKPNISNDIKYEIAFIDWKLNNSQEAITILKNIIQTDSGTDNILESKILLSQILQENTGYDTAATELDESIADIQTVENALNNKKDLLVDSVSIDGVEITELNQELTKTNELISDKNIGRAVRSFPLLKIFENNNVNYISQIKSLNSYIRQLNENNDPTLPDQFGVDSLLTDYENPLYQINDALTNVDATSIRVMALKFISAKEYIEYDDYLYARYIANEIYQLNEIYSLWEKIEEMAKKKNKTNALSKISEKKDNVKKNIQTLYLVANFRFGEVNESSEYATKLQEEFDYMQEKKVELLATKKQVNSSFNKIIAEKLASKKSELINDFNKNKSDYLSLIESVQSYSDKLVEKYEFSKIDLLYEETVNLDLKDN